MATTATLEVALTNLSDASEEPIDSSLTTEAQRPSPSSGPASISRATTVTYSALTIFLTMTSLCLSALLSALDLTILTPAIPSIVAAFHDASGLVWIGSSYILSYTAMTPIWGSVADIWGRKPIIIMAVSIFLAGSLLCAVAPHMDALLVGRVVQGFGGSGLSVMVNVIICDMFSLRDRGLYFAISSVVWAIGSAVGPVLGGIFTTQLSWRWCFWINLPIGAVAIVVLIFFLNVPSPHTPVLAGLRTIDWTGSALIIGGAIMILVALDIGNITFPWSSATVVSLLVFGVAVIGIFTVNEWKFTRNPVIPLWLFSSRSTVAAFALCACNYYVLIGLSYYLPLYSQSVLGANALTSGVQLIPLIVSSSAAAACAGAIIQKTGVYRPLMHVGQILLTLGTGLFIDLDFGKHLTKLVIFEILTGAGVGLNIEAPLLAAQAALSEQDTAAVIATMGFCRSIASAVSVVVGGVVFQNQMNAANNGLVQQLGPNLAGQFNGDVASANVDLISTLPGDQQDIVRRAYFRSLKVVWIMYLGFAGVSATLNFFVRGHKLSRDNHGAVLGTARRQTDPRQTNSGAESTEPQGAH